ncbi:MAG TPA: M48 family metalloprotease [Candidatus Babeliales bacterium]|nr:M48 family metalloprotease [Candidatus Babeliales bacterium]
MKIALYSALFLLIIAIPTISSPYCASSTFGYVYSSLLGKEDASPYYHKLVVQALKAYGVKKAEKVLIKKMNGIGPALAGIDKDQLLSFTAFGIWLNEELLNHEDEAIRIMIIYHEAAHYVQKHHQQIVASLATLSLITAAIFTASSYVSPQRWAQMATAAAWTGATWWGFDKFIFTPLVLSQEETADLEATRVLVADGKQKIVQQFMKHLKQQVDSGNGTNATDRWHETIAKQLESIKTYYEQLTARKQS